MLAECEVEDVIVLAEILTLAGFGVDLLVPLSLTTAAEAPAAAAPVG